MKIKEFFYENKTAFTHIIVFLIGLIISSVFILFISNRRINRANIEASITRIELQRAREEVARARDTISEIRRIQSELTEGLGDNNTELHSIIERLTLIRDKVQNIEDELNRYNSNSDNNDILYSN